MTIDDNIPYYQWVWGKRQLQARKQQADAISLDLREVFAFYHTLYDPAKEAERDLVRVKVGNYIYWVPGDVYARA